MNQNIETLSRIIPSGRGELEPNPVRFDLLFKAFPAPTYIWCFSNGDFFLLDCNNSGETYLRDKLIPLRSRETKLSDLEDSLVAADVHTSYREKRNYSKERLGHKLWCQGEPLDLFFNYAFVEPDIVLMSFNDVTQVNSSLEMLKRLSSAVEQTADAVFITDRAGLIEYVNPAFEHVTGFSREEVLGQTPRILKSGEMPPGYYQKLWKTIMLGKPFQSQTVNHRRDGSRLIVEQTITPIKDHSGKVTHFVSLLKDMTERISLQEKETELRVAGKIQQGLFPRSAPKISGYDISGAIFPATNTSGDCFDYLPMPDDLTGIVIGDVCGHGMGPALIMASARAYLRSITRFVSEPRNALQELHDLIHKDLAQVGFITLFFARLDPYNHVMRYSNAGNWPAYVLNAKGEVTHMLRTDGYPIGINPELELHSNQDISIEPGGMVLFITDGIPEARDPSDKQFGTGKLLEVVRSQQTKQASDIIQNVREAVQNHMSNSEQLDDQTIVICKREK